MLGGRAQLEEAHLADLHARPQLHRQRRHIGQLQRDMAFEARVDEARGGVGEDAEATERAFAFKTRGDRRIKLHILPCGAERELARMQDPRLVRLDFELFGQLALVFGGIHVRVRMVVEQAEETVQSHVDRRRLHHFRGPRIERNMAVSLCGENVAIGQQHRNSSKHHRNNRHMSGRAANARPPTVVQSSPSTL